MQHTAVPAAGDSPGGPDPEGEIDPAVAAVVDRFTALLSQAGGKLTSGALTAPPSDRQLSSATPSTGEEQAPGSRP
jgi:hypothetical protein